MRFIFPKNYNFKPKLLGFIEYSTAILDACIGGIIYFLVNALFNNINIKIYVFISLFFPILLISLLGINKESFISVFKYIYKFFKNQNIYLYKKLSPYLASVSEKKHIKTFKNLTDIINKYLKKFL